MIDDRSEQRQSIEGMVQNLDGRDLGTFVDLLLATLSDHDRDPAGCRRRIETLLEAHAATVRKAHAASAEPVAYMWRRRERRFPSVEESWEYVDRSSGEMIGQLPEKYDVKPLYEHPSLP